MLHALNSLLYGSGPALFESDHSLPESVERLRKTTRATALGALSSQQAVGKVSESRVVLRRVIPFVTNSYKPFLAGKFEQCEQRVVLAGC